MKFSHLEIKFTAIMGQNFEGVCLSFSAWEPKSESQTQMLLKAKTVKNQ